MKKRDTYGEETENEMTTRIRAEISEKNKYWISKHRYYELKHFCLQYQTWKKVLCALDEPSIKSPVIDRIGTSNSDYSDITAKYAIAKTHYSNRIEMIERAAFEADKDLHDYILKAVTEELSYDYLKTRLEIPCSRDMYYDRYRRFFWLLSKERQ